jgi:hypothetical protein
MSSRESEITTVIWHYIHFAVNYTAYLHVHDCTIAIHAAPGNIQQCKPIYSLAITAPFLGYYYRLMHFILDT